MGKKEVQLKTKRLMILPMTDEELENLIRMTDSPELKQAYQEMLDGCRQNQEQRIWYTAWKICLKENKKRLESRLEISVSKVRWSITVWRSGMELMQSMKEMGMRRKPRKR